MFVGYSSSRWLCAILYFYHNRSIFLQSTFQNVPGTSDNILKCPVFSITHSYAPNVASLSAVNLNTPKSCHSKQQHFTAHKLHGSNKFTFHNFNISPPAPPFLDIDLRTPAAPTINHVTHSVQLAQSVEATHNAAGLTHDAKHSDILKRWKCICYQH